MFHVTLSPIAPWPLIAVAAATVVVLTLWAYRIRLRGTSGAGRWVALALRMAAVLLCLLAALRPSVVLMEKVKQAASLAFLLDSSKSMSLQDEVGNKTRFDAARKVEADGQAAAKKLGERVEVKRYRFDKDLRDDPPDSTAPPRGDQSALGTAMSEGLKRLAGTKLVAIVLLSDGASNAGLPPLEVARRLQRLQVPVVTVGFGSETAGAASRDLAVRDLDCSPTVFVKNELQVRGTVRVRGFPNQPIEVELYAEGGDGRPERVDQTTVKAAEGAEVVAVKGLKWTPKSVGEKRLTLRVKPKTNELITSNNELSTYVQVKKGGLNALYLQGPNFSWEYRFLIRALDPAGEIQVDLKVLREPAQGDQGKLSDAELAPGRYDVYILGDVPADYLTKHQHELLVHAVEKNGAGLIMLGGRSSFGAGGWASTPVADILPTRIHAGDGQLEPEAGLKVQASQGGLNSFVMRIGSTKADAARLWAALPPITGANRLGPPKPNAEVLAQAQDEPVMAALDSVGAGRVLAFGGETWVWARASDETHEAHRKFWRQAILWLAHKEDQGENQVKLVLDRRRVAVGQKVELTALARDAKNEPIPDVSFQATVERLDGRGKPADKDKGQPVDLFNQGAEARGTHFANGEPGEYRVTVKATRNGATVGTDTARFLAFTDDRELENPAADLALLRQIAEATGGKHLAPEQLGPYLRSLDPSVVTDSVTQREHRIWDNWPFFLIFTALLSFEWWLRKRIGWV
jgi:uncharacterized membrane protein